jgi:CRP-like cAMP-binding protein
VLFSQGDTTDAVFYIQAGKVKLTVVSPQGKEAVIVILDPGSLFEEGGPRRAAGTSGHGEDRRRRQDRYRRCRKIQREAYRRSSSGRFMINAHTAFVF